MAHDFVRIPVGICQEFMDLYAENALTYVRRDNRFERCCFHP